MKSVFVLAIAGLAASISAQSLSQLPSCALTCLTTGLTASSCSITDFKCACSDTAFVSGSATCIQGSCPEEDQQKALAAAGALCESAGVTIPTTFPASSAAATSSVAATSSAATTSASSTASASTSAAPTTSGSTESFPSVIASSTPLSTLVTSTATTTTASSSGNLTQSVSVPVQTTNAGNRLSGMNGPLVFALGLVGYLAL